ncbi:MAG: tetratricopeptide repeat protein [Flavobacteriales bacterium]|nr:tetratricopeptide repeat protein [Flavobacteriales bacterium]
MTFRVAYHVLTFLGIVLGSLTAYGSSDGFGVLLDQHQPDEVLLRVDSALQVATSSEERSRLLMLKGRAFHDLEQHVNAISTFQEVLELDIPAKAEERGHAHFYLGETYYEQGSLELAQKHYLEALKVYRGMGNDQRIGAVDLKVGMIYYGLYEYDRALDRLHEALKYYESSDRRIDLAEIHLMIGKIHFANSEFNAAEEHYTTSYAIYDELGFSASSNEVLEELVVVYKTTHRWSDAIASLQRAEENSARSHDYRSQVRTLEQKAWFFSQMSDIKSAISALEQASEIAQEHRKKALPSIAMSLGHYYEQNGQRTEALIAFSDARDWSREQGNIVAQRTAELSISSFYRSQGDWEHAYYHMQAADSLNLSIAAQKYYHLQEELNRQKMDEMQIIEDHFDEVAELKTVQDGLMKKIMIGGLIALVIVLFFVYREFIQKRKLSKILEWKVYRRTRELRKANKELNTYIYKSSHDLRTPLTSIKSLLRLLNTEEHTPATRKYLGLIESCTEQMDDILISLSRAVDYKKVEPSVELIDFSKVRYDVEQKDIGSYGPVKVHWNITEKAPFYSDYKLLKVILRKTIANALMYRQGTQEDFCNITITTDRKGAILCIEDNGQGINEKIRENVFDMFVKGTHKSTGAGLGLYLVKIALEKIRGKVVLESTVGKGSKLTFQLPNMN